ncbi:ABC transporter permease [Acidipropionibacterium jensenii]|uniref:ABC transporter permease n=1 Tax=Acidipropionibacterium jensenii TaxID=1749 RepID=A0A3S4UWY3_9ACTN|nr:ABC transporter permease [Acidipropionibacterium jensenii]AZZ39301.1 ABC transporter permease [Acidipropionibacterium jensenii]AZZ42276.1 ABC transporter permease [Acidipropionibacterium jensenii]MDN5976571.1 ABC transporter permease [Acidipropionibacterium jensenii]MDN5995443.1 ABC transporter permease [Acidipropionibacterium jensenii]MDN6021240.1 ABC transporter permease [Acidipropionibacterium jensenii]
MRRAGLVIGSVLIGVILVAAVVSVFWTPVDPSLVVPAERLQGPSLHHLLGTDGFGADIASRLLVGARIGLLVGVVSVVIAAGLGVPWGIASAMLNRPWSRVASRASDLLYAFPALLLAIILAAAVGGSTLTGMIAIGVSTVPVFARITRSATWQVMSQDYVLAARSSGISSWGIARSHVLPNIAPLIGVQASVSYGMAILAEAALSYLGLATPATVPTWGRMLRDSQTYLFNSPVQTLWPGLAIAAAVMGFTLLGDGLRDFLDPRLRELR